MWGVVIDYLTGKEDWDILVGSGLRQAQDYGAGLGGRAGGSRIMVRAEDGERGF